MYCPFIAFYRHLTKVDRMNQTSFVCKINQAFDISTVKVLKKPLWRRLYITRLTKEAFAVRQKSHEEDSITSKLKFAISILTDHINSSQQQ